MFVKASMISPLSFAPVIKWLITIEAVLERELAC